ncbi:hypothetical protein K503DRAFT_813784, partial [Rhizopogon vinicolor AM-OR11-026]
SPPSYSSASPPSKGLCERSPRTLSYVYCTFRLLLELMCVYLYWYLFSKIPIWLPFMPRGSQCKPHQTLYYHTETNWSHFLVNPRISL